jgi:transposase
MNPRATTTERDQTRDTARALTEREVADMLGLSVATLRAWRHRGEGAAFPAARAFRSVSAGRRG